MALFYRVRQPFSTTLQILTRNKNSLKSLSKPVIQTVPQQSSAPKLPYRHMSHEAINQMSLKISKQFRELQVFRNKLVDNPALSTGDDVSDFQLVKVIEVGLRYDREGRQEKQLWERVERRAEQLMRNSSPLDNTLLLFLAVKHFTADYQLQLIELLQNQVKIMTIMQRQLLFYTLCLVKPFLASTPHQPRLNKLREDLSLTAHKSKLSLAALVQWIILSGITNAASEQTLIKYCNKIDLYPNYILSVEQLCTLLKCIEYRTFLARKQTSLALRAKGRQLITHFRTKISNHELLISTHKEYTLLKLFLSYYQPKEQIPTDQQIASGQISTPLRLKYLHHLWNQQSKQQFQIQSLYDSIDFSQEQGFGLDYIYYVCWLEMGLQKYRWYREVVEAAEGLDYVPRGLEWPLYCYLYGVVRMKLGEEAPGLNERIEAVLKKINDVSITRNKAKMLQMEKKFIRADPKLQQMHKFFTSLKLWTFKAAQMVGPVDYPCHFASHDNKIIIHCLSECDYIQGTTESNNEHILNKKYLLQILNYVVIDVKVEEFVSWGYAQRMEWLQSRISQARPHTKIQAK